VPPVANAHQRLGAVHAAFHPRPPWPCEVALDVEVAVEIRSNSDVPERGDAQYARALRNTSVNAGGCSEGPVLATPGEADRERDAGALADWRSAVSDRDLTGRDSNARWRITRTAR